MQLAPSRHVRSSAECPLLGQTGRGRSHVGWLHEIYNIATSLLFTRAGKRARPLIVVEIRSELCLRDIAGSLIVDCS
jgi:hypothetical protein